MHTWSSFSLFICRFWKLRLRRSHFASKLSITFHLGIRVFNFKFRNLYTFTGLDTAGSKLMVAIWNEKKSREYVFLFPGSLLCRLLSIVSRRKAHLKMIRFSSTLGTNKFSMKHRMWEAELAVAPVFRLEIAAILSPERENETRKYSEEDKI